VKTQLTHHYEFDVPDPFVPEVNRFLAGLRGVSAVQSIPNGTTRRKGEMPSKMNESSKRDVIEAYIRKNGGTLTMAEIGRAVMEAGYSSKGLGKTMKDLQNERLLKRKSRGVYVALASVPLLAAPKKKGA
jgi:hypothetical protein